MGKVKYYVRNKPRTFVATRIVGVRAEEALWHEIDSVAEREGIARNGLIVKILTEYINNGNGGK